jgi:ribosomal protein S18 acetylase RimI-like enzyme
VAAGLTLRIATATDAASIRSVAVPTWRVTYADILSPEAIEEALNTQYSDEAIAAFLAKGEVWLLAEEAGELRGFCATEYDAESGILMIHKLYVHPNAQGSGAGKALMTAASQLQPGACSMQLLVNRANHNAQRFYLRFGMRARRAVTEIVSPTFIKEDYLLEYPLP